MSRLNLILATVMLLTGLLISAPAHSGAVPEAGAVPEELTARAQAMPRLHSLLLLHEGEPALSLHLRGPGLSEPANIKSVSKTVLSVLAGMALDRGLIESPDQPVVELLGDRVPAAAADGVAEIRFGHLLSMQAGLQSTSGSNYGRWVQSPDWVAHVLRQPLVDEPGGRMIYSTGTTHLVSAVLHETTGRSTRDLAHDWLGAPLNIRIPDWPRDPQGIHFGGNEMQLSPRALARIGELYRLGGSLNGERILSADWIAASWQPRGHSRWTGHAYGYGWFLTEAAGLPAYYGRGFGGQLLYVVPDAGLTLVVTSDPRPPSPGGRYFRELTDLAEDLVQWVLDDLR